MELDHPQSQNDLKHWTFWRCFMNIPGIVTQLARWNPPKNHWKFSPFKPFMAVRKFSLVTPSRISWAPGKSTQPLGIWELIHCGFEICNGWLGFHIMVDCKWCSFYDSRKNKHIRSVKVPRFPWSLDEYQVNNYAKHTGCEYHPWNHPKGSWWRTPQILIPLISLDLSAMRFTTIPEGFRRWIHIACWC